MVPEKVGQMPYLASCLIPEPCTPHKLEDQLEKNPMNLHFKKLVHWMQRYGVLKLSICNLPYLPLKKINFFTSLHYFCLLSKPCKPYEVRHIKN